MVLVLCRTLFATEVFLDAFKAGGVSTPVVVLPFQGDKNTLALRQQMETIVRNDLTRSRFFQVVDPGQMGIDPLSVSHTELVAEAANIGVSALIGAALRNEGNTLALDAQAHETATGKRVVGVRIISEEGKMRELGHRFANRIIKAFIGETGIAESKIAYVSDLTGNREIYIMDYDGKGPVQLTVDESIAVSPRWSSDGTQISYLSYGSGRPHVYIYNVNTGKRRKVLAFPGLSLSLSWAPSGDRVAFTTTKDGNAEIYTMRPDGTDLRRITFNEADDLSPTWSPTGRQLAFTSDRGGDPQIYAMDSEGGNIRRLTFVGKYNTAPVWSPKGERVAYVCQDGKKWLKICTVRLDSLESVQITGNGAWDDQSPSWAPNGEELVFTSNRLGKDQIFAVRLDGEGLLRLTSGESNATSPAWSPR